MIPIKDPRSPRRGVIYNRYAEEDDIYGSSSIRLADALRSRGMNTSDFMNFLTSQKSSRPEFEAMLPFMSKTNEGGMSTEGRVYRDEDSGQLRYQEPKGFNRKGEPTFGRGVRITNSNVGDIIDNPNLSPSQAMEMSDILQDTDVARYYTDIYGEPSEVAPSRVLKRLSRKVGSGGSAFGRSAEQQDFMDSKKSGFGELAERCRKEGQMSESCQEMMKMKRSQIPLSERLFTPMPGSKRELRKQWRGQRGNGGLGPIQTLLRTRRLN